MVNYLDISLLSALQMATPRRTQVEILETLTQSVEHLITRVNQQEDNQTSTAKFLKLVKDELKG